MMQIPIEELMASLEDGYLEYKKCKAAGSSRIDLAHIIHKTTRKKYSFVGVLSISYIFLVFLH